MTQALTLKLSSEVSPDVREMTARLSALTELVQRPVEIVKIVRDLGGATAAVQARSLPAIRAGEYRLILELSRGGLELLSALRAFEIPSDLIGKSSHNSTSVGCVEHSQRSGRPVAAKAASGVACENQLGIA